MGPVTAQSSICTTTTPLYGYSRWDVIRASRTPPTEGYFAYLEDVDLALRLRLTGWSCRYEPAVALHAGEGSSSQLQGGHGVLVTRNTLLLVAKTFPLRWLGYVAYRQCGWAWHAMRE